jgi:rare lipoprotein A
MSLVCVGTVWGMFVFERVWLQRGAIGAVGLGVAIIVGACSRGSDNRSSAVSESRINPKTGTSASARVYTDGQAIPKGGGSYKIGQPYRIGQIMYVPTEDPKYDRQGIASWYGTDFHGRKTANGEVFDMNALTAAHPTLPIPSYAYVTNLSNNRTILVRINDRGPYANDRIIDLSRRSAKELGFTLQGTTRVRVKFAGRAPLDGNDMHEQRFLAYARNSGEIAGPPVTYQRSIDRSIATTSQAAAPPASTATLPSGLTWRR